jgi:ABC-type multidrug transport system ATPase subunit/ABC-type multidrug transport system permease subunit
LTHLATTFGKTIICTVHQPSEDMLRCWHNLVLLADGRIAYAGPIFDVTGFLRSLGHNCNTDNPVEFALELLGSPMVAHSVTSSWSLTAAHQTPPGPGGNAQKNTNAAASTTSLVSMSRSETSFTQQVFILFRRQLLEKRRSVNGHFAMALRNILAGLLFAMLYFGDGASLKNQEFIIDPFTGLFTAYCSNILGVNFTCLMFLLFANAIAIPAMFSSKRLFDREQGEKLYSYWAFWTASIMVDIPELLLGTAVFDVIVTECVQINGSRAVFYGITFLTSVAGYGMAKLCAWLTSSALTGLVLFSMTCSINLITCGFLIVSDNIDLYLRWLLNLSFSQWSIGQLIYNEFHDFKGAQGDAVLEYYNFEDEDLLTTVLVLALFFVVFESVSLYQMRPVTNRVEVVESGHPRFTEIANKHAQAPDPIRDTMVTSSGASIASSRKSSSHQSLLREHDPEMHFADGRTISGQSSAMRAFTMRGSNASNNARRNTSISLASAIQGISPVRDFIDDAANIRNTYTESALVFERIDEDPRAKKVRLEFRDIKYSVGAGEASKVLLDGVFGGVKSGEMLAIMGSSGAGKTTLLNVIAGRANSGVVSGSITANGEPFLAARRNLTSLQTSSTTPSFAYVMQDDVHIPCLTVRETLEFAAMLRLRVPQRSDARVQEAVRKIIKMLGLRKIAENLIGTPQNRNISCGQIRRLSIGVEIVHDPMLVFLDEPTSGLDSYLASTVVEGMKTLAASGRTVLCTIHQPSTEVFNRFDKLLLLSAGCPIYFGPVATCRAHFESLGIACHQNNPAEFVITVAAVAASNNASENCQYTTKSLAGIMVEAARRIPDSPLSREVPPGPMGSVALNDWSVRSVLLAEISDLLNAWPIVLVLLQRDWLTLSRRNFLVAISVRMLLLGGFIGIYLSYHEFAHLFFHDKPTY